MAQRTLSPLWGATILLVGVISVHADILASKYTSYYAYMDEVSAQGEVVCSSNESNCSSIIDSNNETSWSPSYNDTSAWIITFSFGNVTFKHGPIRARLRGGACDCLMTTAGTSDTQITSRTLQESTAADGNWCEFPLEQHDRVITVQNGNCTDISIKQLEIFVIPDWLQNSRSKKCMPCACKWDIIDQLCSGSFSEHEDVWIRESLPSVIPKPVLVAAVKLPGPNSSYQLYHLNDMDQLGSFNITCVDICMNATYPVHNLSSHFRFLHVHTVSGTCSVDIVILPLDDQFPQTTIEVNRQGTDGKTSYSYNLSHLSLARASIHVQPRSDCNCSADHCIQLRFTGPVREEVTTESITSAVTSSTSGAATTYTADDTDATTILTMTTAATTSTVTPLTTSASGTSSSTQTTGSETSDEGSNPTTSDVITAASATMTTTEMSTSTSPPVVSSADPITTAATPSVSTVGTTNSTPTTTSPVISSALPTTMDATSAAFTTDHTSTTAGQNTSPPPATFAQPTTTNPLENITTASSIVPTTSHRSTSTRPNHAHTTTLPVPSKEFNASFRITNLDYKDEMDDFNSEAYRNLNGSLFGYIRSAWNDITEGGHWYFTTSLSFTEGSVRVSYSVMVPNGTVLTKSKISDAFDRAFKNSSYTVIVDDNNPTTEPVNNLILAGAVGGVLVILVVVIILAIIVALRNGGCNRPAESREESQDMDGNLQIPRPSLSSWHHNASMTSVPSWDMDIVPNPGPLRPADISQDSRRPSLPVMTGTRGATYKRSYSDGDPTSDRQEVLNYHELSDFSCDSRPRWQSGGRGHHINGSIPSSSSSDSLPLSRPRYKQNRGNKRADHIRRNPAMHRSQSSGIFSQHSSDPNEYHHDYPPRRSRKNRRGLPTEDVDYRGRPSHMFPIDTPGPTPTDVWDNYRSSDGDMNFQRGTLFPPYSSSVPYHYDVRSRPARGHSSVEEADDERSDDKHMADDFDEAISYFGYDESQQRGLSVFSRMAKSISKHTILGQSSRPELDQLHRNPPHYRSATDMRKSTVEIDTRKGNSVA